MVFAPQNKPQVPTSPAAPTPIAPAAPTPISPSTPAAPWSASLQTVLNQPPATLPIKLALGGILFFLVFAAWAWFGHIDQVAKAPGKLVPKDEVYKIQPVSAGKIMAIAVKPGQTVKAGQMLVELDTDMAAKDVDRLKSLLSSYQTELNQANSLLAKTKSQMVTRAAIAQAEVQAQTVATTQGTNTIENYQTLLAQLNQDAAAQRQRLQRLQSLKDEGAISQDSLFELEQRLRDRQRTITESQGNLQRAVAETSRLQVGLTQKHAQAQQSELEAQQQNQQLAIRVTEVETKIRETQVLLAAAKNKLQQRFLYAPTNGVVLSLSVHRPGEVVQPQQTLAEIGPEGKPLVLSAVLPNREAGFVKPGMPVKIKLDAYPYQDYGIIPGQVTSISPNSKSDERLGQIYEVEVSLARSSISTPEQMLQFRPGQTAIAEVVTRRRRIADVLLDPLRKIAGETNL